MKEKLMAALERSRNYTLQVAEAMPEKNYDFKPAPTVWNYEELMNHIPYCMKWMEENYLHGLQTDWNPPATLHHKKAIADYINTAYDSLKNSMDSVKDMNDDKVAAFFAVLEHTAHHRGQATTYLRACNITPPEYPF